MVVKIIPFCQLLKAGYNRGITRSHVNEIRDDFREDMVQPAIVSYRDNAYWIIDHQHQSQAIYELNGCDPNTPITCDVRTGLTYEEEADLYYRLNTKSKPLNFQDKIVSRIEAKDLMALNFRDTIESCGYVIGGDGNNTLKAVKTAWDIFNRDNGAEMLSEILSITHASWPNSRSAATADIIKALDLFLCHHRHNYRRDRLIKTLAWSEPATIVKRGDTYYKQVNSRAHTKPYCIYSIVVNDYNSNLKRNKLAVAPA